MPPDAIERKGPLAFRAFHNFNTFFKNNANFEVVAFTAAQIPWTAGRTYPPELSGPLYPKGIPIYAEEDLEKIVKEHVVDLVVLAYSDLSYEEVMHKASIALASGADFVLMGPSSTMLKPRKPVISVCAVRTGAGKSTVSRRVSQILKAKGLRVAVVRHPMAYGDLAKKATMRIGSYEDLDRYECTIEEREEFEPHLMLGNVVYAGVDYEAILRKAEEEADVILWDGGNNDLPFFKPNLHIVVADPHRAGHELTYYPGEANLRMADVVVINKVDTAPPEMVERVRNNVRAVNPRAVIIEAASRIIVEDEGAIKGRRVLVVEDGPTVTHGGMSESVGAIAARLYGASEIVDPRPYAVGSLKETYRLYPHMGPVLPAMGYSKPQVKELELTINASSADTVIIGTPIDIRRIMKLNKPSIRVWYELKEVVGSLGQVVEKAFVKPPHKG